MTSKAAHDDLLTVVATRAIDLRAEFEAQLRAVSRLEQELTKAIAAKDPENSDLAVTVRRELLDILRNNKNVHTVVLELAADVGVPIPTA